MMKKHKPKCKYTNKEALMRGLVLYECKERGINYEELSEEEICEMYERIVKERKDKRDSLL